MGSLEGAGEYSFVWKLMVCVEQVGWKSASCKV